MSGTLTILGIDPGTERTGFAVLEAAGRTMKLRTSGVIKLPSARPLHDRLLQLSLDLQDILKRYRPEHLAVENLFFAKNAQSALKLGHARGVILLECIREKLQIFEYTPTEVKSSVAGSGRASKDQIDRMVKVLLKLPPTTQFKAADQSDAIALALTHAQVISLKRRFPQTAS